MKTFKKYCIYILGVVLFFIASALSASFPLDSKSHVLVADEQTSSSTTPSESIVSYAMKWDKNPNILYVYGGDRVHTLEELDAGKIGTDCSGFVTRVYKHFGYDLPAQSGALYKAAKKVFTSQSEAMPGDICWWNGHVGLYIGENRMIHTNTSKPPNNLIHVNTLGVDYKVPSAYLRMIDDAELEKLNKGGSGGSSSEKDKDVVLSAESGGTLVTESDLTGMVMEESLLWNQNNLHLMTAADLTPEDQEGVAYIKDSIEQGKTTFTTWFGRVNAFLGLLLLVYALLLLTAYILDYVNVFVDIPLVSILTLRRVRVIDEEDVKEGIAKTGRQSSGVYYLTAKGLVARCVILMFLGFFFVSGVITKGVLSLLVKVGVLG